jgi:ribosomal protein S20
MAQIKSQKKRSITNLKRHAAVQAEKSSLKTAMKSVLKAVHDNDKDLAVSTYNVACSKLDKAVSSGIHHKNYASRQKSRLSKVINAMQ